MTTAWLAVLVAAIALALTVGGLVRSGGRRDGKIDQILTELVELGHDHEFRIRTLERGRHRRQS